MTHMKPLMKPLSLIWPAAAAVLFAASSLVIIQDRLIADYIVAIAVMALAAFVANAAILHIAPGMQVPLAVLASLATAVALLLRLYFFDRSSHDYTAFLKPWVELIRENGGFLALKKDFGDYNVPYLYVLALISYLPGSDLILIKLVSVLFDMALAAGLCWAMQPLIKDGKGWTGDDKLAMLYFAVLFLPTVWLNSSHWGQCDSLYTAFAVFSLGCLIRGRGRPAVVMAALSFAVKLQAVFFLPLALPLLIQKKLRLRELIWFPITYIITVLPAIALGKSPLSTLTIYFNQTQTYSDYLVLNAPSLFALPLFENLPRNLGFLLGIAAAAAFVAIFTYLTVKRGFGIYPVAAAFCLFVPFLLPSMHDRYFYLADVLSVGLALIYPRRAWWAPICVQLGSYAAYHSLLFRNWLLPLLYWRESWHTMALPAVIMLIGGIGILRALKTEKAGEPAPDTQGIVTE